MTSAQSKSAKIILIADPEILAVPIKECGEPLIELRTQDIIAFGPSPEIPNNTDYTKMRKSVYERLVAAQNRLPKGLRLRVYEALRSLDLQQMLFDNYHAKIKTANPGLTTAEIFKETTRLVSPVINADGSKNIPPHSTGAAVDVYLIDEQGTVLDMGIRTEDWAQDLDGSISVTDSTKISPAAQQYRKIMSEVLTQAGFVNYPTEYWHWSYGDRYWAYFKQQAYAIYDSVG